MKTAPSRTMSSIMNSIKQNERSESSSDLDSESSSSDESKGKDELFKSLKFSDDILQQMNAKRQEIVGGRRIQATGIQAQTNLNLRKDSAKKEVERVHIEIGAPLGRQLLVPKSSQENSKQQQENNTDVLRSNNDDIKIEKPNVLNKSDKSKLDENLCSHLDLKNKEDSKEAYVASHIDKKVESVTGEKDVSEKEEKVEARTSIKQTYLDEINSFKASLEKDMLKEKASLMKKFNAEISEEMRKLEDERFEKLKKKLFEYVFVRRNLSNAAGEALKTLLNPTVAHRILGSNAAHVALGSRPVATPAAEASPEPVPAHLPGRLLAGRLAHFKDLCEMVP